ncbi:MAG: DsrE family protein [Kaiparowitsia implicata GSE-PSE-MK54-09C]|nr:DsrE family protein [Kaiparowitsia implicata GSE-PSE-MK54-09C]
MPSRAILALVLLASTCAPALADNFLVHIHSGPDNPTKAALGFLVAATALDEGHDVDLFLAGDGASLITEDALSTVQGVGTGQLRDHFDTLIEGTATIYISGKSAEARKITEADLEGKSAQFAMPAKLVELAAAADVILVY